MLDPEQNHTFSDHYLDLDYDLSRVMFVCTANVLHQIPRPLQDRMEIIQIPGYIESEKLQIAKDFLVPKVREANGLKDEWIEFTDSAGLPRSSAATPASPGSATSSARSRRFAARSRARS